MKLAQTNLQSSRRDSLKIARRFNAEIGLHCVSRPGARASARFTVRNAKRLEQSDVPVLVTLKRRERRAPAQFVAPASWSAPALRRFSDAAAEAAEGCRTPKPRGVLGAGFHPEGISAISRGLSESASDTPVFMSSENSTLKGWQNHARKISCTPSGCNDWSDGFRGYRPAQPPANSWQPFRLLGEINCIRIAYAKLNKNFPAASADRELIRS